MPSLRCVNAARLDRKEAGGKETKQEAAVGIQNRNEARLNAQ